VSSPRYPRAKPILHTFSKILLADCLEFIIKGSMGNSRSISLNSLLHPAFRVNLEPEIQSLELDLHKYRG
jgi:hypothetical protein